MAVTPTASRAQCRDAQLGWLDFAALLADADDKYELRGLHLVQLEVGPEDLASEERRQQTLRRLEMRMKEAEARNERIGEYRMSRMVIGAVTTVLGAGQDDSPEAAPEQFADLIYIVLMPYLSAPAAVALHDAALVVE